MNRQLNSRDGKLKFLKGIASGTRSISEINGAAIVFLTGDNLTPGLVTRSDNGQQISLQRAEALSSNRQDNNIYWIEIKTYEKQD